MVEVLNTQRMYLRTSRESFAAPVAGYYMKNREVFEEYESTRPDSYYTRDYQKRVMQSEISNMDAGRSMYFYMSLKSKPDRIIGSMSFANIRKEPYYSTIFGYDLHHELWGQGLATEACRAAIDYMFSDFPIHRIEARVAPENIRSIHVLERLGFIKEGPEYKSILLRGQFRDHIRYCLLNENFVLP
ncbi:MAG: GNAT family N-acetyltransferase [Lachnospiraceae bacterium]|nr:GNAT family N-acetyltransferase [Lachnospiraceae bacterium]